MCSSWLSYFLWTRTIWLPSSDSAALKDPVRIHWIPRREYGKISDLDNFQQECTNLLTERTRPFIHQIKFALPLLNLRRGTCLLLTLLYSRAECYISASADIYRTILAIEFGSILLCSRSIINSISTNPHLYQEGNVYFYLPKSIIFPLLLLLASGI